jgi:hypothetical protein
LLSIEPLKTKLLMKKMMLLIVAFLLFARLNAQDDTTASSSYNPVLFFQVQAVDNVVQLKWSVDQDIELKNFDIERSDNGTPLIKVGSRLAITKNSDGEYDFVDATPRKNVLLQYRLRLITKDGDTLYSDWKQTRLEEAPWSVRLKQNPVRNRVEVELETSTQAARQAVVVIVSNTGQPTTPQVFRLADGKNQLSLSAQSLLPGIYQLVVEAGNERKTISFIKE